MKIELHSHTSEHSPCSRIAAVDLIRFVHSAGADGIVISDHHYLWPADKLVELRAEAGITGDFVILSAQEVITEDFGDILVFGASRSIGPQWRLSDLRAKWPEVAMVWAHPYRYGRKPSREELFDGKLDAIEIVNPHQREQENKRGVRDWKELGFRATSGSDVHSRDLRAFNFTVIDDRVSTIDDLILAIKNGKCSPTLAGESL